MMSFFIAFSCHKVRIRSCTVDYTGTQLFIIWEHSWLHMGAVVYYLGAQLITQGRSCLLSGCTVDYTGAQLFIIWVHSWLQRGAVVYYMGAQLITQGCSWLLSGCTVARWSVNSILCIWWNHCNLFVQLHIITLWQPRNRSYIYSKM